MWKQQHSARPTAMLRGNYYYYNTGPILSVPRVSALNTEGKQDRMVLQEKYFLSQTSLFSFAFSLASH